MPITEAPAGEPPPANALRAVLAELCGQDDGRLFALLDGAHVPNLSLMLRELAVPTLGLYRVGADEALRNALGAALCSAAAPDCEIRIGSLTPPAGEPHVLDDCDVIVNCALESSELLSKRFGEAHAVGLNR
jgi:hypothetical protein